MMRLAKLTQSLTLKNATQKCTDPSHAKVDRGRGGQRTQLLKSIPLFCLTKCMSLASLLLKSFSFARSVTGAAAATVRGRVLVAAPTLTAWRPQRQRQEAAAAAAEASPAPAPEVAVAVATPTAASASQSQGQSVSVAQCFAVAYLVAGAAPQPPPQVRPKHPRRHRTN